MGFELSTHGLEYALAEKLSLPALFFSIRQHEVIRDRSRPGIERLLDIVLLELLPNADPNALHDFFRVLPIRRQRVDICEQTSLVSPQELEEVFGFGIRCVV